jgi:hypothetical protein
LQLTLSGIVPTTTQRTLLPAKGTSFVAQRFPVGLPLKDSNFELLPGWSRLDVVKLWHPTARRFLACIFRGTTWRLGVQNADADLIPAGTACFVTRRTRTGAAGVVAQEPPFTLGP